MFEVRLGARNLRVRARRVGDGRLVAELPDGRVLQALVTSVDGAWWVTQGGRTDVLTPVQAGGGAEVQELGGSVEAPMPGRVIEVCVSAGDAVTAGQKVMVVEAMKMEHALKAPRDGVVASVAVAEGEMVNPGTALVVLEEVGEGA